MKHLQRWEDVDDDEVDDVDDRVERRSEVALKTLEDELKKLKTIKDSLKANDAKVEDAFKSMDDAIKFYQDQCKVTWELRKSYVKALRAWRRGIRRRRRCSRPAVLSAEKKPKKKKYKKI
jgi:prefoldin subunit 5